MTTPSVTRLALLHPSLSFSHNTLLKFCKMVKSSLILGAIAAFGSYVQAKEIKVDEKKAARLYDTGVMHNKLKASKEAVWEKQEAAGAFASEQYPTLGYTKCVQGVAEAIKGDPLNTFKCHNADLYSFLSHADLGSTGGRGSSSWGWTSDDGREFVAIGQYDGTAFAEITKKGQLVYLGRLPQYSSPSQWREIRSYKNYVIIGSEAVGHGIQIFDFKKLLKIDPKKPVVFDAKKDLTSHFNTLLPVGRAHNVVVNEELKYAVAVGAMPRNDPICASGLNFFDLTDPSKPKSLGCAKGDGYVHDAQCIVYRGPDKRYQGRDICYGYNEDTLTIYDVTNKANVTNIISRISYEGAAYTHQGWVLDAQNQEFLVLDDELDERDGTGPGGDGYPVTFIWDIRDLEKPKQTGHFKHPTKSIDHNQYVKDSYIYQSHYGAGLRVLDGRSIPSDPTGAGVYEAAWFDIYPEDDNLAGGGTVAFVGTWSSYAFFKSGYIFINTIERGAFVVKLTEKAFQKP
ncbi:hypothetical protein NW752_010898 [Fusarium irregulare]|uniref:Uncharacterized protein n=1 Tax=Fusarium irregulare TaxID=2494466 RepID=A0A9W8PED3_9HYPO|nr:hypothetical protein NW766_011876 [Fusarium irregulare]KAJ4006250.1 hypothetical protein NW752_010898 [Fusarium irregulare]